MPVFICFHLFPVQVRAAAGPAKGRRATKKGRSVETDEEVRMLHAMLVLFDMSRGASIKLYYDMLGSLWGWWFIRAPFFLYVYFWGVLLTCVLLTLPLSSLTITDHH